MLDNVKKASRAAACKGGHDGDARWWLLRGEVGVNRGHLQCLLFELDRLRRLEAALPEQWRNR